MRDADASHRKGAERHARVVPLPTPEGGAGLCSVRRRELLQRVKTGYYARPEVRAAVVARLQEAAVSDEAPTPAAPVVPLHAPAPAARARRAAGG